MAGTLLLGAVEEHWHWTVQPSRFETVSFLWHLRLRAMDALMRRWMERVEQKPSGWLLGAWGGMSHQSGTAEGVKNLSLMDECVWMGVVLMQGQINEC